MNRLDMELKNIISKIARLDNVIINENTILTSDLHFDSVQIIELIVEIESTFNIEFKDEELDVENLTEYSKLVKILEQRFVS